MQNVCFAVDTKVWHSHLSWCVEYFVGVGEGKISGQALVLEISRFTLGKVPHKGVKHLLHPPPDK